MSSTIYLASRSPRRQALLDQLRVRYAVHPADLDEAPSPGQSPADYARELALAKARAVQARRGDGVTVLGADTDVVIDDQILGKPDGAEEAESMLRRLSGRAHRVYSAVAVVSGERADVALSVSEVHFAALGDEQLRAYVASGEPMDKAGGYAIQGLAAQFVTRIDGSYTGIVGLPLHETAELLRRHAVPVAP